jgi:hypothetical protein
MAINLRKSETPVSEAIAKIEEVVLPEFLNNYIVNEL